jgi:hypothetical protein
MVLGICNEMGKSLFFTHPLLSSYGTKRFLMNRELSSKSMLLDLTAQVSRLREYRKQSGQFDLLIDYLVELNPYYDEDKDFPSLKDITNHTGIGYSKLRRQIRDLYLIMVKSDIPLRIKTVVCIFYVNCYFNKNYWFKIDGLKAFPRIGEQIDVPFLRKTASGGMFYVDEIYHEFEDDKQVT